MKIVNKHTVLFLLLAVLANSCDLDEVPEGGLLTDDQKRETTTDIPERVASDVNGLYAGMTLALPFLGKHYEYGIPGISQFFDVSSSEMFSTDNGLNWFRSSQRFTDRIPTSPVSTFIWATFYDVIKTANDILSLVDSAATVPVDSIYRGQAYAARAYCYLNLVQAYQFTYDGHEESPAVPIVTETMTEEEMSNNPRATVKAVYAQIMSDLDKALVLLKNFNRDAAAKNMYNSNVIYGLRARANMLLHNWKEAADDASKAMEGYTPYTLEEVSSPTFNSASSSSWIWSILITENDGVVITGLVNWPSHLCSLTGKGYTYPNKAWRFINSSLWNQIPESDIRKSWWLDKDTTSKLVDGYTIKKQTLAHYFGWIPYVNVKFGPYKDEIANPVNASDWCLMRSEEMILIQAEALARGGNLGAGKSILENFVKGYRDPKYICKAASVDEFCDEVWFQRRVELWGEGFSFFDMLRLKKPLQRKGSNYPPAHSYDLPAESQIYLYLIPEAETNMNKGIPESANNPIVPTPTPN